MSAALAAVDAQALGHALYDALNRRNEDALPWDQLVQSERNRYSRAAGEVVLRVMPTHVMLREECDDFREETKKLRAALKDAQEDCAALALRAEVGDGAWPTPRSHYCDSGNCEVCGDGTGDGQAPGLTEIAVARTDGAL